MHRQGITMMLATAAIAAAGCTAKDESAARPDSAGTTTAAAPPTSSPNVVTVHAADFRFDAPDTIPAGVTTFRLVNDGETFHHMQLVRLDSAKTFADLQQNMGKPGPAPKWAVFIGGPNAPDPKTESNATLDLAAGNYALLCFVDVPGGVPHVAKGMAKGLTVTPSSGPSAALPTPDVVVTLSDYSFTLSKPLAAGKQTIEVRNTGPQVHEVELIRLAPGKTDKELLAWMQKPAGPPPGSGLGGIAGTAVGMSLSFTADVTPGDYLLICFIPDAKDGKPHFMKGMMQTIKVS